MDETPEATAPYRINFQAGSSGGINKKRSIWRFAYLGENVEHEVNVVQSHLSGKRTLYENGQEVVSNTARSLLDREFVHEWLSQERNLRIQYGPSSSAFYIDGVSFDDLPERHEAERRALAARQSLDHFDDSGVETVEGGDVNPEVIGDGDHVDEYYSDYEDYEDEAEEQEEDEYADDDYNNDDEDEDDDGETPESAPKGKQEKSTPPPICFVFKLPGSASKASAKKGASGADSKAKERAAKKEAKDKVGKKGSSERTIKPSVFVKDPNLSDVQVQIKS